MTSIIKKITLVGLSILAVTTVCFASETTSLNPMSTTTQADKILRVGLMYGTVKDVSPIIKSDTGFNFGYYQSEIFFPLISFTNSKELTIYKNGFSENESLITSATSSSPLVNGKYHIQIGAVQPTFETIQPVLERVRLTDPTAYLAYDGGWRVYIGAYYTQAQYDAALAGISASMMPYEVAQAPFNYTAFMVLENNAVKLLFATNTIDFGFENAVNDSTLSFNKYKYRGGLVFKRLTSSDPTVINYVPLEKYLYGVIPYEISPKWHIEAQKAQAVAARNYAMTNLNKHKKYGFDICNTVDCQVYAGSNVETPLSNQAVDLTKGIFLKYNGKLASTVYHSNSGGRTENAENIWSAKFPYLVGVDDPYSIGSPNDQWMVSYTPDQITQKLKAKNYDIGALQDVFVELYSENGRALKTTFVGSTGKATIEKDKIRSLFNDEVKTNFITIVKPGGSSTGINTLTATGTSQIQSGVVTVLGAEQSKTVAVSSGLIANNGTTDTVLQPSSSTDQYVFNGKGWGHGVGMSQWGAKKMAEQGFTYEQILQHYFQNTYLEKSN